MSSEEEVLNEGVVEAFKTSKMGWCHCDIDKMLQKIDAIRRQMKDPRGAIPVPRLIGGNTRRKPIYNLPYQYYDREWLNKAIDEGLTVVKEGGKRGPWMDYATWDSSLRRR
jgi:hypothetical protein